MQVKTSIRAGQLANNHNEAKARDKASTACSAKAQGVKVKTNLKAGKLSNNHNESILRGWR